MKLDCNHFWDRFVDMIFFPGVIVRLIVGLFVTVAHYNCDMSYYFESPCCSRTLWSLITALLCLVDIIGLCIVYYWATDTQS